MITTTPPNQPNSYDRSMVLPPSLRNEVCSLTRLVAYAHELRAELRAILLNEDVSLRRHFGVEPSGGLVTAVHLRRLESELGDHRRGILTTGKYADKKKCLLLVETAIRDTLRQRNSSIELIRQAVEERERLKAVRDRSLVGGALPRTVLQIASTDGPTGGVLGVGVLLAEGLRCSLPQAEIAFAHDHSELRSAGVPFAVSENPQGTPHIISKNEMREDDVRVHVAVSPSEESVGDIDVPPFGFVFESGSSEANSLQPHTVAPAVCFDLADPRGTVLVNPSLRSQRLERDNWTLSEWKIARQSWRLRTLTNIQNQSLARLSAEENWDIDGAIWGFGYVQRVEPLMDELSLIVEKRGAILKHGGGHVVIHLRPGVAISDKGRFPLGVRVLQVDGTVVELGMRPKGMDCNITVVVHDRIAHADFKSGISQMIGVPMRTQDEMHWLDFPVFCTGAASWSETISAGAIPLHDTLDWKYNKVPQIKAALTKHLVVTDNQEDLCWNDVLQQAASLLPSFVLGSREHAGRYEDLHAWSSLSQEFSRSMYRFNAADDLAVFLIDRASSRARS